MSFANAKYNKLFNKNQEDENKEYVVDLNYAVLNAVAENSVVLDVGCSNGYSGEWLVQNKKCTVYGIDINPDALKQIEEKGLYKKAYWADLDNEQQLNNMVENIDTEFDFMVLGDVLEHLKDPSIALTTLSKKLKLGGQIVISLPNISNLDIVLNLVQGKFNYSEYGILDNTHLRFFTRKSFAEWIDSINSSMEQYQFDIRLIGANEYISEYVNSIYGKYPALYELFTKINEELKVIQNIFVVTKINKLSTAYNLDSLLKSNTNAVDKIGSMLESRTYDNYYILNNELKEVSPIVCKTRDYEYSFEYNDDNICGFSLAFATYNKSLCGNFTFILRDLQTGENVLNKKLNMELLQDNQWFDIKDLYIEDTKDKKYKLILKTDNLESESFSLYLKDNIPCLKIMHINIKENQIVKALNNQLINKNKEIEALDNKLKELSDEIQQKESYSRELETTLNNLRSENSKHKMLIDELNFDLNKIYSSNGWKGLIKYYKTRDKVMKFMKKDGSEASVQVPIQAVRAEKDPYLKWIEENEPNKNELDEQRNVKFTHKPLISIVVPTFNTPQNFLIEMIQSVIKQTYSNWELCIADGGSEVDHIDEIVMEYKKSYDNIKFKKLSENKGIAENSNAALELATGDYIALLDHDDILPLNALFEVVKAINDNSKVDFIYSDEDKISEDGSRRFDAHFKPDWSPDTLRSYNYICHLSVVKKELLDKVGHFREGYNGSQDYDIILRITEQAKNIIHIPRILYHWRINERSVAGNPRAKMYCYESAKKALADHLERVNLDGKVNDGFFLGSYKIEYKIYKKPKVSIIIPNKDHVQDLKRCIESISKSTYDNYEIVIAENNSVEEETFKYYEKIVKNHNAKIVRCYTNGKFNYSAINNEAVKNSDGEVVLLLNNDIEVINADWLQRMVEHVIRDEVGAVGANLYYNDNTIQHAGVILGILGVAAHVHRYIPKESCGYFGRAKIIQNLSIVTGACLMLRREVFEAVNGLDEEFAVAFNDVDFCLRIRQLGKLIVWTPYAELYHYESKSRGAEDTPEKQARFVGEIELFKSRWQEALDKGDPYYNPNLTLEREDFSIKLTQG